MNNKIENMLGEIEELKTKLKEEIAKEEDYIAYKIERGRVEFEKGVLEKQREEMKHLLTYFGEIPFLHLISSPLIYAMIIPAIVLDVMLFIYQQVIFRIYKFEFIKRSDYIVFDRQYLRYLNFIERLNCVYCSYFNGLMHYASEIASKTELYFCPIKHAKKTAYEPSCYSDFLTYGDEKDFQEKSQEIRNKAQNITNFTKSKEKK